MSITDSAKLIWRAFITDGDGGSGAHPPIKAEIRTWGQEIEQRHFDNRTLFIADTMLAGVNVVHVYGHTEYGDGGETDYERTDPNAEPSHGFKLQSADGTWWEGVDESGRVNPRAIGGDSTQVSAQAGFDYVQSQTPSTLVLVFSGSWTISSTVTIGDPSDMTIDARGARFVTPNDILMFDLNGRADPTYDDNESMQNFHWIGGRYECTFSTPLKATAFRMMGFRLASMRQMHFKDFYRDIILGDKDTIHIGEYKSQAVVKASIEIPPWSRVGGPLNFYFKEIHVVGPTGKLIDSYGALIDCVIRDFSCNMSSGSIVKGAIDIHSDVTLGLSAQSGTFAVGETVTATGGSASGATLVFEELYTHDFGFTISQNLKWIVGSARSATAFVTGDELTAGSGATATVSAGGTNHPNAYLNQDSAWQNLKIEGVNHFEMGTGAGTTGAIAIRLRDRINRGAGDAFFNVDAGSCGFNSNGSIGVELQNLARVAIRGRFNQTKISLTDTDISFTAPDLIDSAGSDFGVFSVGNLIEVTTGSATNDGIYRVATQSTSQLELVEQTIATENAATAGSVTIDNFNNPIKLNSNCMNISVEGNTSFSSGVIDLNGMSRDEMNLTDFDVTFPQSAVVTGWTPKALSTVSATIIDMSVDFPDFELVGGLPPKVYEISIQVRDSASVTPSTAKLSIHHPDDTTDNQFHLMDVTGFANDQYIGAQFTVGADSNGDIEYEATASGAGTLDAIFNVRRMLF